MLDFFFDLFDLILDVFVSIAKLFMDVFVFVVEVFIDIFSFVGEMFIELIAFLLPMALVVLVIALVSGGLEINSPDPDGFSVKITSGTVELEEELNQEEQLAPTVEAKDMPVEPDIREEEITPDTSM